MARSHSARWRELQTTGSVRLTSCALQGGDLFQYVKKRGGLREHEARWFFQQLIIGMDYCHRMGVVNRDIKVPCHSTLWHPLGMRRAKHAPVQLENTLLDGSRRPLVKICDFGYSKHLRQDSLPKSKVGTPGYTGAQSSISLLCSCCAKPPFTASLTSARVQRPRSSPAEGTRSTTMASRWTVSACLDPPSSACQPRLLSLVHCCCWPQPEPGPSRVRLAAAAAAAAGSVSFKWLSKAWPCSLVGRRHAVRDALLQVPLRTQGRRQGDAQVPEDPGAHTAGAAHCLHVPASLRTAVALLCSAYVLAQLSAVLAPEACTLRLPRLSGTAGGLMPPKPEQATWQAARARMHAKGRR